MKKSNDRGGIGAKQPKENRAKENVLKDLKIVIALGIFQVLLSTGFLGMPESLFEWFVRLAQSFVAFSGGMCVMDSVTKMIKYGRDN